ncbi:ABC transporter, ATP-binding protein [Treponema primitia ZAS-2]|uniref:ABC transporter, ATP-binding protein n=1 Tax=Treponema primitia (strain ATCC BAA-887 / DSM 12427 / ZAS-2) TaxID=545694 RepID=F5YKT5_TREPZ|nr:ABC-F family ATP-binding cassette domain-containing protein [Treponema primitia]AEF86536.1 ABC transporter, ATP-binding protein [Treponema primitia ZAS-2]
MAFVQFTRVSLAFGDRDILKEVGLNLAAGSRAALAGINGSGKSTLMKVIAGKLAPDSGERAVQKGCRVSYLPQSGIVHRGSTLREEAETAYSGIIALLEEIEAIGRTLETAKADDSRTVALLEEHHRLQEAVENSGYYSRDQSIAMVLSGLGFSPEDLDRQTEEFSGGWQMRIALAKVLLEKADILLLDEPTNYLDIEARSWLELWLKNFTGGYLLVSHDRYFLDVTVNEVYELFQGRLKRYVGNYSAYEQVRQTELDSLLKRYAAQQEEIAKAEDLIRRFRYKATKAAMVQERIKKLEKMERIEIPESLKKISIAFPRPPHSGRIAMTLEGIGKSYGDRPILSGLGLTLESGEKLVVVGRNGAGKTTLLRILAGSDSKFSGSVQYGAGIQPGYFSQDAAETMTGSQQVVEYLEREAPTELIPRVRDMLGAFLFRGDDVYKPISVLSGGEKSRLALLRMLLKPMNLLILDEPTNHLDLQSKDILLDTLKKYSGTIIFVSHDRAFMEALSTKTLELSARGAEQPAAARLFYGDYGYYLDRIEREAVGGFAGDSAGGSVGSSNTVGITVDRSIDNSNTAVSTEPLPLGELEVESAHESLPKTMLIKAGSAALPLGAAAHREMSKLRQALTRRLEREEGEILKHLGELEAEKSALEAELGRPDVYSNGEKARAVKARLDGVTAELEGKGREWEAKAAELEKASAG